MAAELFWNGLDLGQIVEVGYTTADTMYYPGPSYAHPQDSVISNPGNGNFPGVVDTYVQYLGGYDMERWQQRVKICLTSPGQKYAASSYPESIANPLGNNSAEFTSLNNPYVDNVSIDCLHNHASWNQVGTWRTKFEMLELYNLHQLLNGYHTGQNNWEGMQLSETPSFPVPNSQLWHFVMDKARAIAKPGTYAEPFGFVPPMVPYIKTRIAPEKAFGILDTPIWKYGNNASGTFDEDWFVNLNHFQPVEMYYTGVTNLHAGLSAQGMMSTTDIPDDTQLTQDYYDALIDARNFYHESTHDDAGFNWGNELGSFFGHHNGVGLQPVDIIYPFIPPGSTQMEDYNHQHAPAPNVSEAHVSEDSQFYNLVNNELTNQPGSGPLGPGPSFTDGYEPGTFMAQFNQDNSNYTTIRLPHATFHCNGYAPKIQSAINVLPRQFNPPIDGIQNTTGNVMAPNGWLPGDSYNDLYSSLLEFGINIELEENSTAVQMVLAHYYAKHTAGRHALLGMQPLWYSLDEFFIQDYDIAGVYTYHSQTGLPTNHNVSTFGANRELYLTYLLNPAGFGLSITNWAKMYIMYRRYLATAPPGSDSMGALPTDNDWPNNVPNLDSPLDAASMHHLFSEWSYNVETPDGSGAFGDAHTFDMTPWNSIVTEGSWAPLGPPAPPGYSPKCGTNFTNYFNVPGTAGITGQASTTQNDGGYPFNFQCGINFNSENADTLTGYVTLEDYVFAVNGADETISQFLNSYSNTTNSDVENQSYLVYEFLDKEIWKYFHKMYQALLKLIEATPSYTNAFVFNPANLPINIINDSLLITNREKEMILYAKKLDVGMSTVNMSFSDLIGQTVQNFNPFLDNPGGFGGMPSIMQYNMLDNLRNKLVQLTIDQGGIAQWEINNFIYWVLSNGSIILPQGGLGAGLPSPPQIDTDFSYYEAGGGVELGAWLESHFMVGQELHPGQNQITYRGPNFVGGTDGWWQACQYLNGQFPNGNVLSVAMLSYDTPSGTQSPAEATNNILIYSAQPFVAPDGTIETTTGWFPSDYLNGGAFSTSDHNPLSYQEGGIQSTIMVQVSETQPSFYTPAFGNTPVEQWPPGYFQPNVTIAGMITALQASGYDGETLDAYPTTADSGTTDAGDGTINSLDGLTIFNQTGDYRPFQFIKWCELNGLESLIHTYFPIGIPWGEGENIYPGNFDIPGIPPLFYIPPNAIRSVGQYNKAIIESTPVAQGAFTGNEYLGGNTYSSSGNQNLNQLYDEHEAPRAPVEIVNSVFSIEPSSMNYGNGYHYGDKTTYLTGNNIFTQSLESGNDVYGYRIMNGDPDKPGAQPIFTISYGNLYGSGSLKQSNSLSPSEAIYRQYASTLRNQEISGSFYSLSGSLSYPGFENEDVVLGQSFAQPDGSEFFITANKNILGDGLDDKFVLKLEGKHSNGHGATLHLISDWQHPYYEHGTGLKRLTIVSGSWLSGHSGEYANLGNDASIYAQATHRRYGYFYPEIGVWVLNPAVGNNVLGGFTGEIGSNVPVAFNDSALRNNGLSHHGRKKSDKEYNNALLLVNCMRNRGEKITLQCFPRTEENKQALLLKVPSDALNYSLNPSKLKAYNAEGEFNNFGNTMTEGGGPDGKGSATTYPNQIQLYNSTGYLVGVANFSKAIRKDFNKELVIKVIFPLG